MANAKAKAKPAQAQEEAAPEHAEGSWVRFLGYEKGTKKEEMILNKGESYEVVGLPGQEEVDGELVDTGYVLRLENPDFDPKKKENPDTNPKFLETEVFAEEIEAGEAPDIEGEAITYEELAGYSKEELIEFAKANEVKLTAAQKKTPATLLATLAAEFGLEPAAEEEEEEPETPPAKPETAAAKKKREAAEAKEAAAAKPAAKPAGKAAAKGAAAKPAAKGKSAPKEEEEEEEADPDFVPELEGEDEAVLSLVEGDVDLVAVAQDLESAVAVSEYQLGGVLYHIKKEKLHLATDKKGKLVDPEYGETGGFKKFLMDNFNIDYRKATYLIDIYINFTLAGLENPSEVVGRIGWTKASKIAKLIGVEGADVEGLVDVAEKNTVADLSEIIKEQFTPSEDGGGSKTTAKRITLRFRYLEEEANVFEDALKELADQFGVKPDEALFQLVIDAHAQEIGKGGHAADEAETTKGGKAAATKPARGKARA
jgi:hypothetical protein